MSIYIRTSVLTLFVITLFSCHSHQNKIEYAVKQYYLLNNKVEKFVKKDEINLDSYSPFKKIHKTQVPLNKVIFGNNYKTYIGVAFNTNSKQLFNDISKDSSYTIYEKRKEIKQSDTFYSVLAQKNNFYSYSTIYNTQEPPFTIVINMTSIDSLMIGKFFYDSLIINKIETN